MSLAHVVGQAQTYSKQADRYPRNAPRFAHSAHGPYVYTEPGLTRYVDMVSALGAVILGHQHPEVDAAVRAQLGRGVSFSLPTRPEGELAERVVALMPAGDWQVRYAKNGADVVEAAVRVARAATGRECVAVLHGSYHGARDWCLTRGPKNGGVPIATRGQTLYCERHNLDSVQHVLRLCEPAALVIEAVLSSDAVLPPDGYFTELRRLCDHYGALLILDEMVTGFRIAHPGAVTHFGIDADFVCFGKAIANGFPLSVLVGRRELMKRIEEDVFVSSTFGGEAVSLAAAIATLDVLERDKVAWRLNSLGRSLQKRYASLAEYHGVETELYGYAARPMMRFADPEQRKIFLEELTARGILCQGYFNLTLAHGASAVMAQVDDALRSAFETVAEREAVGT